MYGIRLRGQGVYSRVVFESCDHQIGDKNRACSLPIRNCQCLSVCPQARRLPALKQFAGTIVAAWMEDERRDTKIAL